MFGSYLFLLLINFNHIQRGVFRLTKYYKNKIIGFYYGSIPVIIVNELTVCKEVLFNRDLDGRPALFLGKLRDPHYDIKGIKKISK